MEGPTFNPATGMFRSWLCVDSFGTVTSPQIGGGVIHAGLNIFQLAQSCPSSNTQCYATFADTQQVVTCSWTNGLPDVICSTGTFTPNDIGKRIFGFATCKTNQSTYTNSLGATSQGAVTISNFINTQHVQVSQNATGTIAANGCVIWGHPDDAAVVSLEAAANVAFTCPTVQLPSAFLLFTSPHFNTQNTNCAGSTVSGASYIEYGYTLFGISPGSSGWFITPDFNFAACPASGCFGNGPGPYWFNFSINGGGLILTGTTPAVTLLNFNNAAGGFPYGYLDHFTCTNIGLADTGMIGLNITSVLFMKNSVIDGCGGTVTIQNGGTLQMENSAFEDQGCAGATCAMFSVQPGGTLRSYGGNAWAPGPLRNTTTYHTFVNNGGKVNLAPGDQISTINGGTVANGYVGIGTGCYLRADGVNFGYIGAQPNTNGFNDGCTNSTSFVSQSVFAGGTTGAAVIIGGSATFFDLGGNTFSQGTVGVNNASTATYRADGHTINGACTGVSTASSTLGLYGTGPNVTSTTCTSTTIGTGITMQTAGTIRALAVSATAAGVNASSGVVTLLKNGVAQTLTCTVGTSTSCFDSTHTVSYAAGDLLSFQFTTQAAETLAGVKAYAVTF